MESTYSPVDPLTPGAWGWHHHAIPGGWHASDRAACPDVTSWWLPAITTYGGPQLSPMQTISVTRWDAADTIRRYLARGLAVEIWDATPTCLSSQRFAAGPCSPLTCPIGRPMRGAGPRYR